jgi:hypothetical protein
MDLSQTRELWAVTWGDLLEMTPFINLSLSRDESQEKLNIVFIQALEKRSWTF